MAAPIQTRARAMREARRAAQFSKFRLIQLNLIPLVDTFVSIVFFALTTQTLGEVAPVARGVTLPSSTIAHATTGQLTLAIASSPAQISLGDQRILSVQEAAAAVSNDPRQPLLVPALYAALKSAADSIRGAERLPADQSVTTILAIQGDRTMRYDLLARVMHSARLAGFRRLTLQVMRDEGGEGATQTASRS
ncbi:MAG TPA: biopolymer transporter ExbD [Gemmatimonadaceae bacterium]|nr:biopolymer transporter ExbD [Gemmatimonadaceae bacterium]